MYNNIPLTWAMYGSLSSNEPVRYMLECFQSQLNRFLIDGSEKEASVTRQRIVRIPVTSLTRWHRQNSRRHLSLHDYRPAECWPGRKTSVIRLTAGTDKAWQGINEMFSRSIWQDEGSWNVDWLDLHSPFNAASLQNLDFGEFLSVCTIVYFFLFYSFFNQYACMYNFKPE